MMNAKFLRQLVKCFGWMVEMIPKSYQPAAEAFLHSLINDQVDSERPVPEEILPTISYAVLNSIFDGQLPPDLSYNAAIAKLETHSDPVPVRKWNYPYPGSIIIPGYENHPHYYVMGDFMARPQGGGVWLVEDRYDWHVPDHWEVPYMLVNHIPRWILSKFATEYEGSWYLDEVGTLDQWTTPYWHRSRVKLSDYLDPYWFE